MIKSEDDKTHAPEWFIISLHSIKINIIIVLYMINNQKFKKIKLFGDEEPEKIEKILK